MAMVTMALEATAGELSIFNQMAPPEFYVINGFVYANNPPFQMCVDDPVIWYVFAMGADLHVFHMHGNNF